MLRLVGFDLDGTLIRGTSCLQVLAVSLGRQTEAQRFAREFNLSDPGGLKASVEAAARWFDDVDLVEVCHCFEDVELAPGAQEAFARLRAAGISTAIVSLTWSFAAEWFARRLGADAFHGTALHPDGSVSHVLPADKGTWFADHARSLGFHRSETAAVGDSRGDLDLFAAAGRSIYVGEHLPTGCTALHLPSGDLAEVTDALLQEGMRSQGVTPSRR